MKTADFVTTISACLSNSIHSWLLKSPVFLKLKYGGFCSIADILKSGSSFYVVFTEHLCLLILVAGCDQSFESKSARNSGESSERKLLMVGSSQLQ